MLYPLQPHAVFLSPRQLLSGAESLQLVADLLKSIDRISEVSEDGRWNQTDGQSSVLSAAGAAAGAAVPSLQVAEDGAGKGRRSADSERDRSALLGSGDY